MSHLLLPSRFLRLPRLVGRAAWWVHELQSYMVHTFDARYFAIPEDP